ncbi:hypothetical protein K435DRAFT_648394 [Dendrothele bispora CBS 962.96]|uniref:Altered inheritance of mitochondria protein 6 n=1 Tax=Dendrothele bispora (strain CBS 962.96) TaxID=1314807 RepID=A0A4S8MPZ7_DENBC|nr:hypothetical protein K435DRAFT_648394 [Dendrothele bispora CBS 962.96]
MGTLAKVVALFALAHSARAKPGVKDQITFLESSNSTLLQYPTQFSQGIVPKQIHSHNDYWRDVPLLTALSHGVASVEADVWLVNETLYVGHERAALTANRTLDSLYIQPLLQILDAQNPDTPFNVNATAINGVFDTSGATPLQLLVDMKTDGTATYPFVLEALEPLRQRGYLTTFKDGILTTSAVTVIGTGNTPLGQVKSQSPRDLFFDAPLTGLNDDPTTNYDPTLSPIASTDYEVAIGWSGIGQISEAQLTNITKFVGDAHSRGIKARFWDTPGWPIQARNNVWQVLVNNGADWLNADDLAAASNF